MNYLYSNLVEKKENLTFHLLNSVISDSLNNWPQQNGIIIYYEVTSHNESKLKNYLVEEKITDELIKDIPVYKYFFMKYFQIGIISKNNSICFQKIIIHILIIL
jgi:hypothetical protein